MFRLVDIYDQETLAEVEGLTYTNLRTLLHKHRQKNGGELGIWQGPKSKREYRFFGKPGKVLYAYEAGEDITLHVKQKD